MPMPAQPLNEDLVRFARRLEALVRAADDYLDSETESRQLLLEALVSDLDSLCGDMFDAARPCCVLCDGQPRIPGSADREGVRL